MDDQNNKPADSNAKPPAGSASDSTKPSAPVGAPMPPATGSTTSPLDALIGDKPATPPATSTPQPTPGSATTNKTDSDVLSNTASEPKKEEASTPQPTPAVPPSTASTTPPQPAAPSTPTVDSTPQPQPAPATTPAPSTPQPTPVTTPTPAGGSPVTPPTPPTGDEKKQLESAAKAIIKDLDQAKKANEAAKAAEAAATGKPVGPKKNMSTVAKAAAAGVLTLALVVGGYASFTLLQTPGTAENRSQADTSNNWCGAPPSGTNLGSPCEVEDPYAQVCGGDGVMTYCGDASGNPVNVGTWHVHGLQCCAQNPTNPPAPTTPPGQPTPTGISCSASVTNGGPRDIYMTATACAGQAWSATLYLCAEPDTVNNGQGFCSDTTPGVEVRHINGAVDNSNWQKTVSQLDFGIPAGSTCKYAQLDGAVNTPGLQETGYVVFDDRDDPECVTATPIPTPTATPIPSPTPTTPPEPLACFGLTISPESPQLGDAVTLTCSGSEGAEYADFQYSYDGTNFYDLGSSDTFSFYILANDPITYWFRCRVCNYIPGAQGEQNAQCSDYTLSSASIGQ